MTSPPRQPNRGGVDVVCVEYRCLESALGTLQGCRGQGIGKRLLVRCGDHVPIPPPLGLEILPLTGNPGFGAACNRAASRCRSEWILFLNPDCRVGGEGLRELLAQARTIPRLGALGPGLVGPEGSVGRSHGVDLHSWRRLLDRPRFPRGTIEVDWVAGTCLLVRRSAFDAVGGFDERFFLYCEDADLCRRLRARGYRVAVTSGVTAEHRGGISFPDQVQRRTVYQQGRQTYMRKHAGPMTRWLWRVWRASQARKEVV